MTDDWAVVEEALERLYINVRAEYPFSVRDKELVSSALARLRERDAQSEETRSRLENRCADWEGKRFAAEARVARLEEALREIAELPDKHEHTEIARRAVAHEEEA